MTDDDVKREVRYVCALCFNS